MISKPSLVPRPQYNPFLSLDPMTFIVSMQGPARSPWIPAFDLIIQLKPIKPTSPMAIFGNSHFCFYFWSPLFFPVLHSVSFGWPSCSAHSLIAHYEMSKLLFAPDTPSPQVLVHLRENCLLMLLRSHQPDSIWSISPAVHSLNLSLVSYGCTRNHLTTLWGFFWYKDQAPKAYPLLSSVHNYFTFWDDFFLIYG